MIFDIGRKKTVRAFLKDCLPYSIQRRRAAEVYGLYYPDLSTDSGLRGFLQRLGWGCLPFGVVRKLKSLPRDGAEFVLMHAVKGGIFSPRYSFPRKKRRQFLRNRQEGRQLDRPLIERNRDCSILVILHLFYDNAWTVIREYLENLSCYEHVDWIFTYTEGHIGDRTIQKIRSRYPAAKVIGCENRGYDLWPFVHALEQVDLTRYDVVYKLHSKGIGRPEIFIYDQIFKYSDWFFNLFDGVLDGRSVHRAIDMLMNDGIKLTAAENLIVHDPKHKMNLMRKFCADKGLPYRENYSFVAGTCFAARAEMLEPLKKLNLSAEDFAPTVRGVFSEAHAIERWLCFAAGDAVRGIPVPHPTYERELKYRRATSPLRMLEDPRFILDDEFFYHALERHTVAGYEVIRMKLKDIRRRKIDGAICPLSDCEPYHYLCGDEREYRDYCRKNLLVSGYDMSVERFDKLNRSLEDGYDPKRMPVVQGPDHIIRDGQHRCCILLKKYGPEHEIDVLHFW